MRLSFSLLAIGIILISSPGCEKKPCWLRIYREGEFKDSINVRGWRKNEDVVRLGPYFYYPWQGEDSISYSFSVTLNDTTYVSVYSYLVVNGRLVGIDPFSVNIDKLPCKEEILTLRRYDSNYTLLPNLVMMPVRICSTDDIKELDSIPRNIRLDVYIASTFASVDFIPAVLPKISRFRNVRVLEMTLLEEHVDTDLSWIRWLCRMRRLRRVTICVPEATTEWEEARIESRLKCLPRIRVVELEKYSIWVLD
ncbi:hypothetical protein ES703_99537 [subsurface metagenome]